MMGMMPSSPFSTAVPPREERRSSHSLPDRHKPETRSSHSLHDDRHNLSRSQSVQEPIAVGVKGSILSLVDRDVSALRSSSSANASSSYSTAFVSKPWPDPYWQDRPRLAEASRRSRSVSSSSSHAARLATLALCARDVIEEEEGEEESRRRVATSTPGWKRFLRKLRPASSNSSGKQQLPIIAPSSSSSSSSSTFTHKGRCSTKRSSKAAACNGATASSSPLPSSPLPPPSHAYKQDPKLPAPIASCPPLWERRHMPHLAPLDLTPSWQLPKRRRPLTHKWN